MYGAYSGFYMSSFFIHRPLITDNSGLRFWVRRNARLADNGTSSGSRLKNSSTVTELFLNNEFKFILVEGDKISGFQFFWSVR